MTDTDVIVVGMGPTGAALAGLLGQRGVRVTVLDRLPDLFPMPRAAGIDQDVMRIVQELGVADRVVEHISPYRPSEYLGVDGQVIRRLDAAPPPHRLGWAPNYVFEQPQFERILRERLAELPSVTARTSAEVTAFGQDATGVWADVATADGPTQRVRGQFLVACDGGGSPVRKQLGIGLEDLGFDEPWLVVDVIVDDETLARLPQTQVQYCEPERPCTYVVGVGNHRRWEIRIGEADRQSGDWPENELWPLLKRWIDPGEGRIWRSAAYRFHGLVARAWRRDRVLLAGDAAHMTPPFMAQGMAQGMRDAQNLAWKLDRVLRGASGAGVLDSYEIERKPHVTATTRTAMALGRVICERDPAAAAARDARLLAEQGGTVQTVVRQNLIPPLDGGLLDPSSPAGGTVMPQPTVGTASFHGRLDDLTGPAVRLVALAPLDDAQRADLQAALRPLDGVLLELAGGADGLVETFGEELLAPWLRELSSSFALVRPDHYVVATAATLPAIRAAVDHFAGQVAAAPAAAPPDRP